MTTMTMLSPAASIPFQLPAEHDHIISAGVAAAPSRDIPTDEQLDEDLRREAQELGITFSSPQAPHDQPTALQDKLPRPWSADLTRRSLESARSRGSRSTDLTSQFSELSREGRPSLRQARSQHRSSLSVRDYDAFLARETRSARNSIAASPSTMPTSSSTFSLPLTSPETSPKRQAFRRLRGLSILKRYRSDSRSSADGNCQHCAAGPLAQRRAIHRLPCGHRLCTQAMRSLITSAQNNGNGTGVPSCCGMPVPGQMIERVMTLNEQELLFENMDMSDRKSPTTPPMPSQRPPSVSGVMLTRKNRTVSIESKVDSLAPSMRLDVGKVMESEEYKVLRQKQWAERDRCRASTERDRVSMQDQHQTLRTELRRRHEAATEDLVESHNLAMSEAEDKQVKAEADLRDALAQERRDNATALKHMEAYCAGLYSNGEPHLRHVRSQDMAELDKTRRLRNQMDAKHESAINVLRGEQGRRIRLRAYRQAKEVQELRRAQRMEELEQERNLSQDLRKMDEAADEQRARLVWRWQLQGAVLVKKMEKQMGVVVQGRLPPMDWQGAGGQDDTAANTLGMRTISPSAQDTRGQGNSTGIGMAI